MLAPLNGKQTLQGQMGAIREQFYADSNVGTDTRGFSGGEHASSKQAVKGGNPQDCVRVYLPDTRFPLVKSWANKVRL